MRISRGLGIGVFTLACLPAFAAPSRRALVIGNDSYPGHSLQNARNDARGVAETLQALGYQPTLLLDADRVSMSKAVDEFAGKVLPGDTTILYYAGHGLQVQGENYLVPTDFRITDEADVRFQGYPLSIVLEKLTLHGAATQVVILDACRDNPFLASRSTRDGWAGVATSAGTFLAFGTSPGSTASDDPSANHGLFTKALLKYLGTSPLDAEQMFQKVREEVIHESNGHQVPWTASSLIGSFHFIPEADNGAPLLSSVFAENMDEGQRRARSVLDGSTTVTPRGGTTSTDEGKLLNQAADQLRGLKLSDAITTLQAILSIDPRCALAFRLLGLAWHLTGRDVDATRSLDTAIALQPNDPVTYAYRCLVLADSPGVSPASDCQKSISLRSDLPEAHLGLAVTLAANGQTTRAYAEVTRAIALDPESPISYKIRGDLEAAQGRSELAERDYSKANQLTLNER